MRNRGVPPRSIRSQIAALTARIPTLDVSGLIASRWKALSAAARYEFQNAIEPFVLTHDFAASISSADCFANAFKVFATGLTIALRPRYEAIGKPRRGNCIGTASRQLPSRICHRAALRHQPLGAQGANLLLPPVRLELPGCWQQGCRARHTRRTGDWRRKPAALQYLRRGSLPCPRGLRLGGHS